jgi:two-component system OmpR family sensor kinase
VKNPVRGMPLRIRLIAAVVLLVAGGLAASGAVATTALHSYLLQRLDSQLASTQVPHDVCTDFGHGPRPGPQDPTTSLESKFYVAHYERDGGPACTQAPNATAGPDLGTLTAARADELSRHPFTAKSVGDGGDTWRTVVTVLPGGDIQVVASSLSDIDHTVSRLIVLEVMVGVVVLVLLAGAGYIVIERSLKPLVEVEQTAAAIASGDLSQRVPDRDPRTEVGRLARALNSMLAQIEHAFARQHESEQAARMSEERMRRFVADASHELRTPLTSIRGFAELYRQGAVGNSREVARVMGRVEDEAQRMGLLVDDLLLLARLDQERPLVFAPVDLLTVAADAVHDAQAVAPGRDVRLDVVDAPPVIAGDEARLRQVVHNLVTNALAHTPAGTPITVRLSSDDGRAIIEVIDHGTGLTAEARDRVFERFYRVDTSRTRDQGGSGLGLSIVAALVAAHGGSVRVDDTPGGGATFRVELPMSLT